MKAKMFVPAILIALSGLVGSAHAVTVSGSYTLPTAPFQILSDPNTGPTYYELIASDTTNTTVLLEGSFDTPSNVQYAIWLDEETSPTAGSVTFDPTSSPLYSGGGFSGANPDFFLTFIMEQGKQYVLSIFNESASNFTLTAVSAVPLPGALWLFGTALLGFLGISSRRKA